MQYSRSRYTTLCWLLLAACSDGRSDDREPRPGSPEPPASVDEPDEPSAEARRAIAFAPCEEDPDFECGTLEVPVDYAQPRGAKLQLAVIRRPATGPGERIGALFVNNGGPGGTGVDFVLFLGKTRLAPLNQRFDLVSFDPRGTGRSQPTVHCDFEPPPAPTPGDAASRAQYLDEHAQRFTQACLAQTGPVVTKLGTNNAARDIDRLRAALGEETINFHGASYGSELGAVYASLFPRRVRAMILDGGVPDTFRDYTIEAFTEEAAGAELALRRVDEMCRRDPSCPLQGRGIVDAVDEIMAKLRANPVPWPEGGVVLREADAALALMIQLYTDRQRWGNIPAFVVEALANNWDRWLPYGSPPEPAPLAPEWQVYASIFCNDWGARRPAADFVQQLLAAEGLFPRVGKFAELEILLRTCHKWPTADIPVIRDVSHKLEAPIMLVANDYDPATPMVWTRHLARGLGMESSVIRYQGGGHTATSLALRGVPCIDAVALSYLHDLQLPPAGFSCPALPVTWAAAHP